MDNKNETDKALVTIGNIFKIFAVVVTVLIIAFFVYIAANSTPKQASLDFGGEYFVYENFFERFDAL